jgi:uncharacterized surface protein with fasciclin (FAS1) repeats
LPRNLSATLPFLNVDKFQAALQRTGLLAELDARPRITVLAPTDAILGNISSLTNAQLSDVLKRHILINVPAYTPLIRDGASFTTLAGGNVTASVHGDDISIGGALIVSGDSLISNGVVHTVDRVSFIFQDIYISSISFP